MFPFNLPVLHRLCFAVPTALWYPPCKEVMTNENKRSHKVAGGTGTTAVPADRSPAGWIAGQCKAIQLREAIAEQNGLSPRTLYRYEAAYRKGGFPGLKPQDRESKRSPKLPENFDELLEQAIQLKREVPKRSVRQIIYILELEGRVAPGVLKRSTMERYLYKAGFGVRQMQMYNDARKSSSKRFCKPHRMMLIQGDIKYGIKLPIAGMELWSRLISLPQSMTIPGM